MIKSLLITLLATAATSFAGTPVTVSSTKEIKEESLFDKIWALPTIYENKDNPYVQDIRIIGKAHFDVYNLDSSLGEDSDWRVRRLRVGVLAHFIKHLELCAEMDMDPQGDDPLYSRLLNAYLAWKFNDAFKLTVGKQSVKFTLDGSISSGDLITVERNNIANNFWFTSEYASGVSLSGKVGEFQYLAGYYSGGTQTKEFGNFDAGEFLLASVGYDFGKVLGFKKALLRGDYVHNERNIESNATRPLENVFSLHFQLAAERWGVSSEVTGGTGFAGQSDAWGYAVMPWYNITKNLQVVGRYTYINSEDANGIRFNRYENVLAGSARGDEYKEYYLGLNYYIYGHKLKIQTGLTWAEMEDTANDGGGINSVLWTTGLRINW